VKKNIFSINKIIRSAFVFVVLGSFSIFAQLYTTGSVAIGPMRGLTKGQFINAMKVGWNLGNTMDGSGTETGWGQPVTTQAMLDCVAKQGFKTLREPVTWSSHFGGAPTYTIDASFMARVAAIANYALNDSMYVIVNTHHDGWYNLGATGAAATTVQAEVVAIWTQIANEFKNYSDYLIFEIFNEPNAGAANQYGGGDATSRANLAAYQTAAVAAIRATGGNNATRMIMLQGISASPIAASVATIPIPDANILVSIHTYDPGGFSMNCSPTTWGTSSDSSEVRNSLTSEQNMVATKGKVAVVGEWGSEACDVTASRATHAYYYAQQCRLHAMVPIWWDDGGTMEGSNGYGILDRRSTPPSWAFPTIAQALVNGANSATFPTDIEPSIENKISLNGGLMVKAGIVNYALPKTSSVSLCLYDVQGKIVSTLVKTNQSAGNYEVKLPTKGITSGNYVLELKAGNNLVTKRINIM
jgi:endoglucanase